MSTRRRVLFFAAAGQAGVLTAPPVGGANISSAAGADAPTPAAFAGLTTTTLPPSVVAELESRRAAAVADPLRNMGAYFAALMRVFDEDLVVPTPTLGNGRTRSVVGETALVALILTAQLEHANLAWPTVATPLLIFTKSASVSRSFKGTRVSLLNERIEDAHIAGGWSGIEASGELLRMLAAATAGDRLCSEQTLLAMADRIETLGYGVLCNPEPCRAKALEWRALAIERELASEHVLPTRRFQLMLAAGQCADAYRYAVEVDDAALNEFIFSMPPPTDYELYKPLRAAAAGAAAVGGAAVAGLPELVMDQQLYNDLMTPPSPPPSVAAATAAPPPSSSASRFVPTARPVAAATTPTGASRFLPSTKFD